MNGQIELILFLIICFVWLIIWAGRETKEQKIVPIHFLYLNLDVVFRHDEDWWQKKTWKSAVSSKGIEKEIAKTTVVGALLEDLSSENYKYILNND